jgi:HEAT repeat protein
LTGLALPWVARTADITALARDDDATVRAATLSGLAAASASHRWMPLLAELADDPDPPVRHRVALVAHHFAPHSAGDILRRLTNHTDPAVRRAATTHLDRLTRTVG